MPLALETPLTASPPPGFAAWLRGILAEDPAGLDWPREIRVPLARRTVPGLYDSHNALLGLYGVQTHDFTGPALAPVLAAGQQAPELCTRLLVFAPDHDGADGADWVDLGFKAEGTIPGFWANGSAAVLQARLWGPRAVADEPVPTASGRKTPPPLPAGWLCRVAEPEDAPAIRDLLATVFPGYPIPADPGAIGYALAGGLVHGRVVITAADEVVAYASAEWQPGGGAPEITDCATAATHRGQALMDHLTIRLRADLAEVFDRESAYALAREDRPAMARVLARRGWRRAGRLVNHYRVGPAWVSAGLWTAGRPR